MSLADLTRKCLYNWYGYGNPLGSTWFIGMEEGGAEIWKDPPTGTKKLPVEERLSQSLKVRSSFEFAMDFIDVWKRKYNYSDTDFGKLISRGNVWRFIAVYLLYTEGRITKYTDREERKARINSFIWERFGRRNSECNHFLCEFLPLPLHSRNEPVFPYSDIWPSARDYRQQVRPERLSRILEAAAGSVSTRLIVSFDRTFVEELLDRKDVEKEKCASWPNGTDRFVLYRLTLKQRIVTLCLSTPFFGRGLGYAELFDAANRISRLEDSSA